MGIKSFCSENSFSFFVVVVVVVIVVVVVLDSLFPTNRPYWAMTEKLVSCMMRGP